MEEFNNSPVKILESMFPEHEWLPWKFENGAKHFWSDIKNQQRFMEWAGKELKIKELSDWYNVSVQVLKNTVKMLKNKGFYQVGRSKSLVKLL